jgi:hypothetical protein
VTQGTLAHSADCNLTEDGLGSISASTRKTSAPRTCLSPLNTSPTPSPVNASRLPSRTARASLGASAVRYSFTVTDVHRLPFAGLPAHPYTTSKAGSCTAANLETQQKLTAPARSTAMTDSISFFHFPYGLTLFCLRLPGLPLRGPFQPCCVPGVCVEVAEVEPEFGACCVVAFPEVVAADPDPPPPPANAPVAVVARSIAVDRTMMELRDMGFLLW